MRINALAHEVSYVHPRAADVRGDIADHGDGGNDVQLLSSGIRG